MSAQGNPCSLLRSHLCFAAMHRIWSSKVKMADRNGCVPLLPAPPPPPVTPNREGVDEEDEYAGVIDDLAGLCTVTWRHLESSLSVTTSTS